MLCAVGLAAGVAAGIEPALATNLVTGNGYGFAVVVEGRAEVHSFYAHPYSFVRTDPKNALSEGEPTTNFLKSLAPGGTADANAITEYDDDSQIIQAKTSNGDGYFFMPFGMRRDVLIVDWESASAGLAGWSVQWKKKVKSDQKVIVGGREAALLTFDGAKEALLLIPMGAIAKTRARRGGPLDQSNAWALISLDDLSAWKDAAADFTRWSAGMGPRALTKREITELERWRVRPAIRFGSDAERHLWRQSEVLLRMAQCREANHAGFYGNGLIVASLPDGVFSTPWVRDMAWATVALARMGHREEARAALLAYFNARPTGKMRAETAGADYQVSVVRYFGDGEEEPFFTEEGSTNIEYDDWGEVLWALGEYMRKYDDSELLKTETFRGRLYESARDYVVKPLLANLEPYDGGEIVAADTSIWEERQKDKKHFAFSTAMAIVGLREFARITERVSDTETQTLVAHHLELLQKGFDAAFIRDRELKGTHEEGVKNDVDGALLAIIHFGVVRNEAVVRNTLDRMKLLKVDSGGYRRVRSTYTNPAIFEYWYERQEFLFVDFSLAEVERQLGRDAEAKVMLDRIEAKAAADHDILPEMYVALDCKLFPGKIGDPTGARPMVGYGAGEFVLDLLDREDAGARHRH